ncbi:type VII secretion AAA-ATPase EccA, partial [Mycobacterium sp. ITM-2017-0098]
DVSPQVIEAVWQTSATAGVLQREIELTSEALGFTYDTGLYLQFRAATREEFALAYAVCLCGASRYEEADELVGELLDRRPTWLQARWVRIAIYYRAARWAEVVRMLTPLVTDQTLDDVSAHAARITLGIALARLGMFAPALSHLERPEGPVAVAAVDGALAKALSLRAQGEDDDAHELLQELYA